MASDINSQQLHAINTAPDIREALEARVKDPLWFLARQWQTGEFEAESGGRPAQIMIDSEVFAFEAVTRGKEVTPVDTAAPLDAAIEAEDEAGDAPAWNAEALEYEFGLNARGHAFVAAEYDGRALDWHDFALTKTRAAQAPDSARETVQMVPNQLSYPGAPDPRWWAFEEGDAYFENPEDPEPNALSILLPEFTFADVNNWYIVPAPMPSGSLRKVHGVDVVDSFGVRTTLGPAMNADRDADWALFGIDGAEGQKGLSGEVMMAPNVALQVVENDELEEVRFVRDESTNLVWAWERQVVGEDGSTFSTGSERPAPLDQATSGNMPEFRLKSQTARAWIPYVPRQTATNPALNGQISLRRGRTDETAGKDTPQYRSKLVSEATHIAEEQIPLTPLRVRRVHRYARGSDGEMHFWVGRDREISARSARPGLRFDYLDE